MTKTTDLSGLPLPIELHDRDVNGWNVEIRNGTNGETHYWLVWNEGLAATSKVEWEHQQVISEGRYNELVRGEV